MTDIRSLYPEELKTNFFSELWLSLLRVFAPLM